MGNNRVTFTITSHNEQPVSEETRAKIKDMAKKGKIAQEIKEETYLYSTLDYPEKLTYTNGEVLMVPPKGKLLVDGSIIDKGQLRKGLILKEK